MRCEIAKRLSGLLLAAVLVLGGGPASADDWDQAADTDDNGTTTANVPAHGSEQVHDLGARPGPLSDQDWYRVPAHPLSSYEFVIDGMTGDLDLSSADVQGFDASGGFSGQAAASDAGHVLSLDWLTGQGNADTEFVRVDGASCGTACTAADRYRARFYETTYTVPRFNNSGTQSTILLVQNATSRSCLILFAFLDPLGAPLATNVSATPLGRELTVLDTSAFVPGQSGSIRIRHTCGYGGLSGKAVSIEPATGFTFDTPFLHRPR
jgi:hypothetical protein